MLTVEMEEKRSREVHMEDTEVDVVRELVNYLYTANISPGFVRLEDLLVLANRSEGGTVIWITNWTLITNNKLDQGKL